MSTIRHETPEARDRRLQVEAMQVQNREEEKELKLQEEELSKHTGVDHSAKPNLKPR